jgi:hypothetical protein
LRNSKEKSVKKGIIVISLRNHKKSKREIKKGHSKASPMKKQKTD